MVRRIFQLTIEGKDPYDIARILFDDKIDTPAVYFGKQNKGVWKSKEEFPNPYNWSGYIVGQILSKPEYMGHTVNFRSHKQSYKDKNAVINPNGFGDFFCEDMPLFDAEGRKGLGLLRGFLRLPSCFQVTNEVTRRVFRKSKMQHKERRILSNASFFMPK